MIEEYLILRSQIQIPLLAEGSENRGGLRPKRTVALLSPFAEQSRLKRLGQLQVAGTQIGDLLHAGPSVEHRGQQSIVAASLWSSPVDRLQNGIDLFVLQVVDGSLLCALERDADDSLSQVQMFGIPRSHETKERVNGGEPDVSR